MDRVISHCNEMAGEDMNRCPFIRLLQAGMTEEAKEEEDQCKMKQPLKLGQTNVNVRTAVNTMN